MVKRAVKNKGVLYSLSTMKTIELTRGDWNDLSAVITETLKKYSNPQEVDKLKTLEFKTIMNLQKVVSQITLENKAFIEAFQDILKERDAIVKVSSEKIAAMREVMFKKAEQDGVIPEDVKKNVESLLEMQIAQTNDEIMREINPKLEKLNAEIGKEMLKIDIADDKCKNVVDEFPKIQEFYLSKEKMVAIYEKLTA